MTLKLGKKPAREGAYSFKLLDYIDSTALPTPPAVFGHYESVKSYGMLGNDEYGDCVWAGADHEEMLWLDSTGGADVAFATSNALADYSAVTGFNPNDPNSDQGTDMEEAAKYRRKTGVIDATGKRHLVDAYLELPGVSAKGANTQSLLSALGPAAYLFGAVGIGIEFPDSAMKQFNSHQPWSVVAGSKIDGGHYIPLVGRRANGNYVVVTWGALQEVTGDFLLKYVDEAIAYISLEALVDNKSLEGFDITTLRNDLAALGGTTPPPTPDPVPTPTPTPSPTPVPDSNVQVLDDWASKHHTGSNAKAAAAWKAVKATHNL